MLRTPSFSSYQPASQRKRLQAQQGFTLIEVMVSLAILASLAMALMLLISQLLDTRANLTQARQESPEQLVDFLTRVDRQLAQLVVRTAFNAGQPINRMPLSLHNNNRELYWVAAGQWVLPLNDYASRLRLWRLSWLEEEKHLLLESSGLLDAAREQDWTLVARLENVSALNFSFLRQKKWENTLRGRFPEGLRLEINWQGKAYQRLIVLPEIKTPPRSLPASLNPNAAEGNENAERRQNLRQRMQERRNRSRNPSAPSPEEQLDAD